MKTVAENHVILTLRHAELVSASTSRNGWILNPVQDDVLVQDDVTV